MDNLNSDVLEIEVLPEKYGDSIAVMGEMKLVLGIIVAFIVLLVLGMSFRGFSINSIFSAMTSFINEAKEVFMCEAELWVYILILAVIIFSSVFGIIYHRFFFFKSNSLKMKNITFTNKGIKTVQQKRDMVFENFYEYASIDSIFYRKKRKNGIYYLVFYLKDKTRFELNFYSKEKDITEKIQYFSKYFDKIKEIK